MLNERTVHGRTRAHDDSLTPQIAEARARLQEIPIERLVRRTGCTLRDGVLHMRMLWESYTIRTAGDAISPAEDAGSPAEDAGSPAEDAGSPAGDAGSPAEDAGSPAGDAGSPAEDAGSPAEDAGSPAEDAIACANGDPPSPFTQALILSYLVTADGTPPSGQWIAYRDLPNGMFYAQAFRGYAEVRLVRELGANGLDRLRTRAGQLGARPIAIGDAGYAFRVLPRVDLAIVYWLGDEDFPSRTSVLFEDTAPHYMSTDGLAVLGSHLVGALLEE